MDRAPGAQADAGAQQARDHERREQVQGQRAEAQPQGAVGADERHDGVEQPDGQLGGFASLVNGAGAAGVEIDRADTALGTSHDAVVLATATGFSRSYGLDPIEIALPDGCYDGPTSDKVRADLVLLALGYTGPEVSGLVEQLGCSVDAKGTVSRNADYMSTVPGVFVAGDMGRGQSLIVWAIAEGRAAASADDERYRLAATAPAKPFNSSPQPECR